MIPTTDTDERMTPKQFEAKYGRILAVGLWGARWVGSAITKSSYIYLDHSSGKYVTESR